MKKGIGKENYVKNKGSFEKKITLVTSHCPNKKKRGMTQQKIILPIQLQKSSLRNVCVCEDWQGSNTDKPSSHPNFQEMSEFVLSPLSTPRHVVQMFVSINDNTSTLEFFLSNIII